VNLNLSKGTLYIITLQLVAIAREVAASYVALADTGLL
jgi:hypothetical protein